MEKAWHENEFYEKYIVPYGVGTPARARAEELGAVLTELNFGRVADMPFELQYLAVRIAVNRTPALTKTRPYIQWARANVGKWLR